jgi:hypothetical protein
MKPTEQQLKVLQDYLHKTLTYRESYEEIYDHILSALQHQPEGVNFQDTINAIIINDFGGHKNLLKVEKAQKDALVSDMYKKYRNYFISYFKTPNLFYVILAWAATYFYFTRVSISTTVLVVLFTLIIFAPYVICLLRFYTTGYILGTKQKSAKDRSFGMLAGVPTRLFVVLNALAVWSNASFYSFFSKADNYILVTIFLAAMLFNLALYKLYKNEFNIVTAK